MSKIRAPAETFASIEGPLADLNLGASWELKCVERVILCYGTRPNMPELRASNDSASHHGER